MPMSCTPRVSGGRMDECAYFREDLVHNGNNRREAAEKQDLGQGKG